MASETLPRGVFSLMAMCFGVHFVDKHTQCVADWPHVYDWQLPFLLLLFSLSGGLCCCTTCRSTPTAWSAEPRHSWCWSRLSRDGLRFRRQAAPSYCLQSIPGLSDFAATRFSFWGVSELLTCPYLPHRRKTCNHEINSSSWTCKCNSHVQLMYKG